ncbi:hypothetical protein HK27_07470 [Acetobacter orientalis]|uniref:hypothetical protein n=1 Tax=Acetobacter orientalis TaxID=146474 RepID=UPI000A37E013|nr:hypothetical protein [Acetobacter orientalis]OUJ15674.1 hypothetical protein HK27_07470 [Acetobacter orientalis]
MTQNHNTINAATFSGIYGGNENNYSRSIEFFHNISQKKSAFDEAKYLFNEKIEALEKRKNDVNRTDLVDVANMYRRCIVNAEEIEEYINSIEGNESKFIVSAMKNANAPGDTSEVNFVHHYWLSLKKKFFENKEIPEWVVEAKHNTCKQYFELIDILK